ncbi:MAG: helix-hairpin-helix domain-containing protein [Chloroflexota bacterium]|nr:helix-hairpin-helix domain-containing protein [Chloroflexota bacterium]
MIELSNTEIAAVLDRYGVMLQLAGESPFRARAYARAAESVRGSAEPVAALHSLGRLRTLPGVGDGLAAAIAELVTTGEYGLLAELEGIVPSSLIELLSVPGIGLKTAIRLYQELGITNLEALETALEDGEIEQTKGLGKRTAATMRLGLESVRRRTGRLRLGTARPVALALLDQIRTVLPEAQVSLAGSVRRWQETVADIDLVVASPPGDRALDAVSLVPSVATILDQEPGRVRLRLQLGVEVDVFWSPPERFGTTMMAATGTPRHLQLLDDHTSDAATEGELYARLGLPWIPPELRHGRDEVRRAAEITELITVSDINGEFHCHTTWSDGTATVAEMAAAAAARGYTFLAISDHSQGLGVANGLSPERLAAQRVEIDAVNARGGIRLLAGAEVEVHSDGRLDFDEEVLSRLDIVVASLHVRLRQPRDQLTRRLLDVLANPNVDIVAHPSGRLIEQRDGGDFDWDRVFAAAAAAGTALEINADPARLDLSATHSARALAAGCLITINCDAHAPNGFAAIDFGVAIARQAWAKPEQILNCWSLDRIDAWLDERGSGRGP